MAEPQLTGPGGVRLEQVHLGADPQRVEDHRFVALGDRCEPAPVEAPPEHGGRLQDLAGVRGERGEPHSHGLGDAAGQHLRRGARCLQAGRSADQAVRAAQRGEQLLDEQRDALRAVVEEVGEGR